MPKSPTLSPVEDSTSASASVEEQSAETSTGAVEAPIPQEQDMLLERLAHLEGRLARLEQVAHNEHHIELGQNEITAIADMLAPLLAPQVQSQLFDLLKKHYGFAPPMNEGR